MFFLFRFTIAMKTIFLAVFFFAYGASSDVVDKIQKKLHTIHTLKARLVQKTNGGAPITGGVYIKRPGCLKIVFYPPTAFSLVVNQDTCVYEDALTSRPFHVPLERLPVRFLLNPQINLRKHFTVQGIYPEIDGTRIDVQTKDGFHKMSLFFTKTNDLRGWSMTDFEGNKILVTLEDIQKNIPLTNHTFTCQRRFHQKIKF